MNLACLTYVLVIYCGADANYVHFLQTGVQFFSKSEYYIDITQAQIDESAKQYPSNIFLTKTPGKCGCPIPSEVSK